MPHVHTRLLLLAAAAAMLFAGTPATAQDVKINIGLGAPPIVLTAPPQFVVVPGTSVSYAPDVQANLWFCRNFWCVADLRRRAPVGEGIMRREHRTVQPE